MEDKKNGVPVRGNYQGDLDVVRDFAANRAVNKVQTLANVDAFKDLIMNKTIKEQFSQYIKDVSGPMSVLKNEDKLLTKHLTKMYEKAYAGTFDKNNIPMFAEPEAKALNKGVIHPSLLQKNEKIKALNLKLNTANKKINDLTTENTKIKKENTSLNNLLTDAKSKYQNLAGSVMKTFKLSQDQIVEMSANPVELKTDNKLKVKKGSDITM